MNENKALAEAIALAGKILRDEGKSNRYWTQMKKISILIQMMVERASL